MTGDYLLFEGRSYYPDGGWGDYAGTFSSLDEARDHVNSRHQHVFQDVPGYSGPIWVCKGPDWAQVVHNKEIVAELSSRDHTEICDCWSDDT